MADGGYHHARCDNPRCPVCRRTHADLGRESTAQLCSACGRHYPASMMRQTRAGRWFCAERFEAECRQTWKTLQVGSGEVGVYRGSRADEQQQAEQHDEFAAQGPRGKAAMRSGGGQR